MTFPIRWHYAKIPAVLLLFFFASAGRSQTPQRIWLANKGQASVRIALPVPASVTQQFAASELAAYLKRITGAAFPVVKGKTPQASLIRLEKDDHEAEEEYSIGIQDRDIVLSGGSDRAILYAAYDFLHLLGCLWLSPEFSFYNDQAEYIPRKSGLYYESSRTIHSKPRLKYRKLDVEEGRSHNLENLRQMIEWMPKLRFNTLMIPLNYGGWGKVQWDNWREALTPELKKRGLMIEVGGHGYQNFLNASMEDSSLFSRHPDWFGRDRNCVPTPDPYAVFNTANPDAVSYLIHQVEAYIRRHPEIDIFDCWPPDGARWADCKEWQSLGSPLDRQAALVNQVDSALKKIRPDIKVEIIAYQPVLGPPPQVALHQDILVDYCPINQQFEKQIFDPEASINRIYLDTLQQWRQVFPGDIGLYSYYRKYAWRSLPVIIPHYIRDDLKWYAALPVQGISTYAEPGDWLTYELNYYALGHLAWDPDMPVDTLIDAFCRARYGSSRETARTVYDALEKTVRTAGNIPYTSLKPAAQIAGEGNVLAALLDSLAAARQKVSGNPAMNLLKLEQITRYALYDLRLQEMRKADPDAARAQLKEMTDFLEASRQQGLFILPDKNLPVYFAKRYGLNN